MSVSGADIRQKLDIAADLHGVVRTMKAMAASNIERYEQAVRALAEYEQVTKLGLAVALRYVQWRPLPVRSERTDRRALNVIIFGSDQGLVGQFNDVIADHALSFLATLPGRASFWAVGERVAARIRDAGLSVQGVFPVPSDVNGIASLVAQLQVQTELPGIHDDGAPLYVFHNRPLVAGAYEPMGERLLPLDSTWRDRMIASRWPGKNSPEVLEEPKHLLRRLVRESLFISVFQACAESLASENANRLAAMQRAETNINDTIQDLTRQFHRARQTTIDQELFDVLSGFEALS